MNMTEGKPLVLLSVFALPLLIGNIFQQAYNLADSMIVGRMLGANALAAVGSTGSISFLFFSLFNGISGGCGVVTAQFFGAREDEKVRFAISNSAYITLTSSICTGLLAFMMVPTVLSWMGTPREILPDAITYMQMTSASVPFIALYNYASSMQRALGDSRTPLIFLIFSCLINVGLDVLFIGAFHLGVFGATLAVAGFMVLLMQLFGQELTGLFVREEHVIILGGQALKITSLFYIFLGIIYASRGVLNGVGDVFFSFLNGFVEIIGRIGLPLLLLRLFTPEIWLDIERAVGLSRAMENPPPASVWVIWITAGLTWLLAATFCMLRYFSWKRKQLKQRL